MVSKETFIKFLNYIGIINEMHHAKLYKHYQRFYNKSSYVKRQKGKSNENENYKKYRVSNYKCLMQVLEYDELVQDKIIDYLIRPQYREKIDIEISIYSGFGIWGKELKNEV